MCAIYILLMRAKPLVDKMAQLFLLLLFCLSPALAANWTELPDTRCHDDIAELVNVTSLAACEAACFAPPQYAPLVTFCGAGADACNGLNNNCWCYASIAQRSACTSEAGWQSAWTSASPPPPSPAPADWARAVSAGDMLFWGGVIPAAGHMPSLGNGYLAKAVGPYHSIGAANDYGSFYLAGVFSGIGNSTPSQRAAIPDVADPRLRVGTAVGAALDLRGGAYLNRTLVNSPECAGVLVQQRLYAHRAERELFVVELRATAAAEGAWPAGGCMLTLDWAVPTSSPDFNTTSFFPGTPGGQPAVLSLVALSAETPAASPRRVAVAFPAWLAAAGGAPNVSFAADGDSVFASFVLRSDLDAADPAAAASADWTRVSALGADALLTSHAAAWDALWASGGFELEGNLTIAAAANSSMYAILSALRADVNFSTCPGGLSTNSYHGHTFWDLETWMFPPLLLLHPDLAAGALQYRLDRLDKAIERAPEYGFEGADWPWESAFSGIDTVAAPNIEGHFEHHISGDIAMAMRQYYLATQDKAFLSRAWPALNATCAFWACRFVRTDAPDAPGCGSKVGVGNFTIRHAQGPDENAGVVDDSLYTIGVGAATLSFCADAARDLGLPPPPPLWATIAMSPYMPTSDTLYAGGPVHPEYRGYAGAHINQADVALLQYPLGVVFERGLALRDLDYYSALTGVDAPAAASVDGSGDGLGICPFFTGNSAYGIAYLALGNRTAADYQFELGFLHQTPEFGVWTEYTPEAGFGHLNFITGAGGWLQALLYGYPGLRLPLTGGVLRFATPAPTLPPGGITRVKLRGMHLLGTAFDFAYDANRVCVALRGERAGAELQLRSEATGAVVAVTAVEACLPLAEVVVEAAAAL